MTTALITTSPALVYNHWWSCIPALPAARSSSRYRALRRVWFDHTMNTFKRLPNGTWAPNGRGFYTEGGEDHVTPALFETFAVLPPRIWFPALLNHLGIPLDGEARRISWSYSFEEPYQGKRFCIADIVVNWTDSKGPAIAVIEAKVAGGRLGSKDLPDTAPYLRMPSMAAIPRRHYRLLVDASDSVAVAGMLAGHSAPTTWQVIRDIQRAAFGAADSNSLIRELAWACLDWNFTRCLDRKALPPTALAEEIQACLKSDRSVGTTEAGIARFFEGTLYNLLARADRLDAIGSGFRFASDPSAMSIFLAGKSHSPHRQSTNERRIAYWKQHDA